MNACKHRGGGSYTVGSTIRSKALLRYFRVMPVDRGGFMEDELVFTPSPHHLVDKEMKIKGFEGSRCHSPHPTTMTSS